MVRPPAERARGQRPTSIPHFAKVWHDFARVRSQGVLEWLGPCAGPGDDPTTDTHNDNINDSHDDNAITGANEP